MSPIHSVKETMKILTNLHPQERDQLQESVMVTVATTLTKHPSSQVSSESVRHKIHQRHDLSHDFEVKSSINGHLSDRSTEEDEYGDDEEEEIDEEIDEEEEDDDDDDGEEDDDEAEEQDEKSQSKMRNVRCDCEICRKHRTYCSPGNCLCFRGSDRSVKKDKSTSTAVNTSGTQNAIAEYRPFVLQSPFNFGMEYFARSVSACKQEVQGQVIGDSLPSWLNGTLVRVGPGKWDLKAPNSSGDGTFTMNNWLDGCAMLTKYRIDDGKVYFSSKFLESDAYKKMMSHGKPVFTEFGTRAYPDPDKGLFSRIYNTLVPSDLTDNDISNIYQVADKIYTATESCNIWQVDIETLSSNCKINLDKLIKLSICSSHPHYSSSDNYLYNVGCTFLTGMKYHIIRLPIKSSDNSEPLTCCGKGGDVTPFAAASIWTSFPSSHKTAFSYSHSFFITQNYIVFVEQPLLVNGLKLATCTPKGKAMTDCLEWHPNTPVRFHLIDKKTGRVSRVKYTTDAFFFFHAINSYETTVTDDDTSQSRTFIVLDIVSYESPAVLEKYNIANMRNNLWDDSCQPRAERYILPIDDPTQLPAGQNLVTVAGTDCTAVKLTDDHVSLKGEALGPKGFELPRINYKLCNGKPYRFIYGTGCFEKGFYSNSVCKLDVNTKTPVLWRPESETAFAGEAVFIPRPEAVEEDDGILLSVVIEVDRSCDKPHYLVMLDAKTMKEIARAQFPQADVQIPPSIHGIFVEKS